MPANLGLFWALDKARGGNEVEVQSITNQIDQFQTHVAPIIADIDAGFGNEEATYLLARRMIEAGACAIQIENQVSDEKQCGQGRQSRFHRRFHRQDRAIRYAFLELGVEDGIIVARTDSPAQVSPSRSRSHRSRVTWVTFITDSLRATTLSVPMTSPMAMSPRPPASC